MSKRVLEEIVRKLEDIERKVERLERARKKSSLSFSAALPPPSLCKDIVGTDVIGNWDNHMQILSDYYGIEPMGNYSDKSKVPKGSIACYHPCEGNAYYKKPTTTLKTVLHEFFHHLVYQNVVDLKYEDEEKRANKFAEIIIRRGTKRW